MRLLSEPEPGCPRFARAGFVRSLVADRDVLIAQSFHSSHSMLDESLNAVSAMVLSKHLTNVGDVIGNQAFEDGNQLQKRNVVRVPLKLGNLDTVVRVERHCRRVVVDDDDSGQVPVKFRQVFHMNAIPVRRRFSVQTMGDNTVTVQAR